MLEHDWENSVGYWICSTSHALRKALGTKLANQGMTLRQWEVLAQLSCRGCESQSELADGLGIEPHTLAGVLNRMERDGYLKRVCCQGDRRKNKIEPTAKAEEVWVSVGEVCQQIRHQAVAGMSAEDLSNLKRLCGQIRENLCSLQSEHVKDESALKVSSLKECAELAEVAARMAAASPTAMSPGTVSR